MKTIVDKLNEVGFSEVYDLDESYDVNEGVFDKIKEKFKVLFNKVKDWVICTFSDGKAIPLTEQEIYDLGVEHKEVVLNYQLGDTVRVTDGPLAGFSGVVDELEPDKDRVRVVVSMFGRETPAELELNQVKPL